MDRWTDRLMEQTGQIDKLMDKWIDELMYWLINRLVDRQIDKRWIGGYMD